MGNLHTDIKEVSIERTTNFDLPAFDHTKLSAINVCPTWGLVRYNAHRTMPTHGRAMALEAGSAAHEVYAAVRIFHLLQTYPTDIRLRSLVLAKGVDLFGEERHARMLHQINPTAGFFENCLNYSLTALSTGAFYDDPSDKRRTLANIEAGCIKYIQSRDFKRDVPHVIPESGFVGVEVAIDITITFTDKNNISHSFRYTGRCDGVHRNLDSNKIEVHENKTASRLNEAWRESFRLSHQITGYCVGNEIALQEPVEEAAIHGMSIPLPRDAMYNGIVTEYVSRTAAHKMQWLNWLWHTYTIWDRYKDAPLQAPQYTHSCNRYFRPCLFIPLCDTPEEDRQEMFNDMVVDEWTPLKEEGEVISE